jgi:hypothetical protein
MDQTDVITPMDPGHPLSPRHDRAASKEPERQQHLRQGSAILFQHHPGPQDDDTHPELRSLTRLCFPLKTQIGKKSLTPRRFLIQHTIVTGPVIADTGGVDQRARFGGTAGQGFYQQTGGEDPAFSEESLAILGPAGISNGRTSEIYDGIGTFETGLPGSCLSAIPLDGCDG